jgi:hypothetical protein
MLRIKNFKDNERGSTLVEFAIGALCFDGDVSQCWSLVERFVGPQRTV